MREFPNHCPFPNAIVRVQVWKDGKWLCEGGDSFISMPSDHVAEDICSGHKGDGSSILGGAESSKAGYTSKDGWSALMV
jgi:hypothetical protein